MSEALLHIYSWFFSRSRKPYMTYRYQQCHCFTALPAKMSVFNSHVQGSHSVIPNKPRLHTKKKHIRTITPFWTSNKLILITVTENVQNCECIHLLWKTSCTLLFQILKLPVAYTCASWFQTVLKSSLFPSCVEFRIIFEVQLYKQTEHAVSNEHGAWDSWRYGSRDNHQRFRVQISGIIKLFVADILSKSIYWQSDRNHVISIR